MKKIILFIVAFTFQQGVLADGFSDNFKDIAKPNNWSDSMKRWTKGDGAWNNWGQWGRRNDGSRNLMNAMTDMGTDMTAEAMGDAVSEVEFEFWVKSNFRAKTWYQLDGDSKHNVFNYWQNNVVPFQQSQQNRQYYSN